MERESEKQTNHTWELFTTFKGIMIYSGPALPMFILFWVISF